MKSLYGVGVNTCAGAIYADCLSDLLKDLGIKSKIYKKGLYRFTYEDPDGFLLVKISPNTYGWGWSYTSYADEEEDLRDSGVKFNSLIDSLFNSDIPLFKDCDLFPEDYKIKNNRF